MIKRFKMREIKYRFILKVSGIGISPRDPGYYEETIIKYFTLNELMGGGKFINLHYEYNIHEVIGISQFTGLLDVINKEIYEDDIILNWTVTWLIKWGGDDDYCGFIAERIADELHELFINHNWRNGKVIGNKYINPELLIKKRKRDNLD